MTDESTKPLSRPSKRDVINLKLENYIDESNVEG